MVFPHLGSIPDNTDIEIILHAIHWHTIVVSATHVNVCSCGRVKYNTYHMTMNKTMLWQLNVIFIGVGIGFVFIAVFTSYHTT